MKRNMNKILGATAMLLVSVLMLGTASFAWFAMNTNSVADGLTVEAYTDSNYLEISMNDSVYDTDITYTTNNTGLLRLVTNKRFNANEIVSGLVAAAASGNYAVGNTTKYYKAVKADKGTNYIHVEMTEDDLPSSTKGLFKNPTITKVSSDEKVSGTFYKLDKNAYVKVTLTNESAKGYYTIDTPLAEGEGSRYVEGNVYYALDSVAGTLTKVANLHVGTDLSQYYTIAADDVTITDTQKGDGTTVYYLKNTLKDEDGDPTGFVDYSYVGTVSSGEYVKNYIYWGRAYSDNAAEEQADNTLNIIDMAAPTDYYLQQVLYLRQAEGTNLANNLRVKDIKIGGASNALNGALRVLLVATSTSDPTNIVTVLYDAGEDTYNGVEHVEGQETVLFSRLLGNEEETIKVDVYIFFDGTDEVAKNTTMDGATLNGQSVEIEFSIDELSYNK